MNINDKVSLTIELRNLLKKYDLNEEQRAEIIGALNRVLLKA